MCLTLWSRFQLRSKAVLTHKWLYSGLEYSVPEQGAAPVSHALSLFSPILPLGFGGSLTSSYFHFSFLIFQLFIPFFSPLIPFGLAAFQLVPALPLTAHLTALPLKALLLADNFLFSLSSNWLTPVTPLRWLRVDLNVWSSCLHFPRTSQAVSITMLRLRTLTSPPSRVLN